MPAAAGSDVDSNESSPSKHILLPKEVFPIFRQYYHHRQIQAFGNNIRFVPLGARGAARGERWKARRPHMEARCVLWPTVALGVLPVLPIAPAWLGLGVAPPGHPPPNPCTPAGPPPKEGV